MSRTVSHSKGIALASPYLAAGFYEEALARGRHRDIVGGRWDETGRIQMQILREAGLEPQHRLLDIGCGALRLGHLAVPYLAPGHYWGTDASLPLMRRGHEVELRDRSRLPINQLVEDRDFAFPGIPDHIDLAIAFGVFTHLPSEALATCMINLRAAFPHLQKFLFTVFLAPEDATSAHRQADGVVTHGDRPPYHRHANEVLTSVTQAGFKGEFAQTLLPRGQVLCIARPLPCPDPVEGEAANPSGAR